MTGAQLREARRLLGWSVIKLSLASKLPTSAIARFEQTGRMSAAMHGRPKVDRVALLRNVLAAAGIEFIGEDGACPGVQFTDRMQ